MCGFLRVPESSESAIRLSTRTRASSAPRSPTKSRATSRRTWRRSRSAATGPRLVRPRARARARAWAPGTDRPGESTASTRAPTSVRARATPSGVCAARRWTSSANPTAESPPRPRRPAARRRPPDRARRATRATRRRRRAARSPGATRRRWRGGRRGSGSRGTASARPQLLAHDGIGERARGEREAEAAAAPLGHDARERGEPRVRRDRVGGRAVDARATDAPSGRAGARAERRRRRGLGGHTAATPWTSPNAAFRGELDREGRGEARADRERVRRRERREASRAVLRGKSVRARAAARDPSSPAPAAGGVPSRCRRGRRRARWLGDESRCERDHTTEQERRRRRLGQLAPFVGRFVTTVSDGCSLTRHRIS